MRPGALRSLVGLVAEVVTETASDVLRSLPETLSPEVQRAIKAAPSEVLERLAEHGRTVVGWALDELTDRDVQAQRLAEIERERPD